MKTRKRPAPPLLVPDEDPIEDPSDPLDAARGIILVAAAGCAISFLAIVFWALA